MQTFEPCDLQDKWMEGGKSADEHKESGGSYGSVSLAVAYVCLFPQDCWDLYEYAQGDKLCRLPHLFVGL